MAKRKRKKHKKVSLSGSVRLAMTAEEVRAIVAKMKPAERAALSVVIDAATERVEGA